MLVAKQAACLDVLSGGRFRLGIGVGWNEVEFVGLNEDFHNRGRRSEEQVQVMQALWAEPHVNFKGQWHHIDDAGINPLPAGRRIPIWFGGHHDLTLRRIAKWGDGWMMNAYPTDGAEQEFAKLRAYAEQEGRDPARIGIEVWVSTGAGDEASWREGIQVLEARGRHSHHAQQRLPAQPPPAHRVAVIAGPSGRPGAVPQRGRRPLVRLGRVSAHGLHGGGLDFENDPDFVRSAEGIFVFPEVFLGEGIDVRRCAVFGHVSDPTADLNVTIGILGSSIESATGAFSVILRAFTRPLAEFTRSLPSA